MGLMKMLVILENAIDVTRTIAMQLGPMQHGGTQFLSILGEMEEYVERLKALVDCSEELPF